MRKSDLAQEILRTVPEPRLIAAIGSILAQRQRRAAGLPDDALVEVKEVNVEEFVATCTKRQLRLLREIVLGLDLETEGSVH
jgi:hypothetical protein